MSPEDLKRELDERFAAAMARHRGRDAAKRTERAQKARARKYGLRKRHEAKLARINAQEATEVESP
jgi:hypothetical protein